MSSFGSDLECLLRRCIGLLNYHHDYIPQPLNHYQSGGMLPEMDIHIPK
jgi:hypothetical protein